MDATKIKVGGFVNYATRASSGRGKVVNKWTGLRGDWITVQDKATGREINLRPAQVTR